ncbi:hypothetical protein EDB85DRAFT_392531 [Lactarius pseudohatsudake]|nr:hypothetical protein EDB85DRAFT_392531 [Lactarius pseudohatsudake]
MNDKAIDGNAASIEVRGLVGIYSLTAFKLCRSTWMITDTNFICRRRQRCEFVSLLIRCYLMPCALQNRLHLVSSFFKFYLLKDRTHILVSAESAWFHLTSHGAIADVLSHPTNPSDVVLEYAPNIGICKSCFAITPVTRILSVLSEPINCRRDGGRSIPACQASSGQYPHIQSLMMTASIPKHIHSLASSTERMDPRFLVSVPSVQSSPLTPATIRMDFEFSAVVAFILRRIVSNHVQYPL